MMESSTTTRDMAVRDFRYARSRANRERLLARITGRASELLCYEDVREKLRAQLGPSLGLRSIPLDAIVGSVGRCSDFSWDFLPLKESDQDRWSKVREAAEVNLGLPPIKAYRLGDVYFVSDGNHRVSVARQMGLTAIDALVTEIATAFPLAAGDRPRDLLLKAEALAFAEETGLDQVRPEAELTFTRPGQAALLKEQIRRFQSSTEQNETREVPYREAVGGWHDRVYKPVMRLLSDRGLTREFPSLTEIEVYLLLCEHRESLVQAMSWEVELDAAADHLVRNYSSRPRRRAARTSQKILDVFTPAQLVPGPEPGAWRKDHFDRDDDDCLFSRIVVPVTGEEFSWPAVAQAAEIACREEARLLGVHIVPTRKERDTDSSEAIRKEFMRHSRAVGARAGMATHVGPLVANVTQCALWADLTVLGLPSPRGMDPVAWQSSELHGLIRRCPTPVLVVPGAFSPLSRPLLAFDGSPRAFEALHVAAYLAQRGGMRLTVITVAEDHIDASAATAEAEAYLERSGVDASLVRSSGSAAQAILDTAERHESDLVVMGGYGHNPMAGLIKGGTVDSVLRASQQPVLICK